MPKPTREDAALIVQLAQWSSSAGLVEAIDWIFSDDFVSDHRAFVTNFPPTSERYRQVHTALNFFETVATLHKHGLINEDLLFDWLAVEAVWDRIKGLAIGDREQYGIPALWENFEAMAKAQAEWSARRDQGSDKS